MQSALRKHNRTVHGITEEIKCKLCDEVFDERTQLTLHLTQVHKKNTTVVGKNKCPVCDKVCISKSKLERHMRVHTGIELVVNHHYCCWAIFQKHGAKFYTFSFCGKK